jgi:Zn-dependent protease
MREPLAFALLALPLLYSVILHEVAHGWVADKMGDPTARVMGRLSLNPLRHLDPMGTLMLFLVGFGWARPVPVNFAYIGKSRAAQILVSAAGIIVNMFLAFAALFLLQTLPLQSRGIAWTMLYYMAQINIILAAFNLIPIPPLDGSRILMGFVSHSFQYTLSRLEPYGFFIIIGLLFFGILDPVINVFRWIILSIIGMILL